MASHTPGPWYLDFDNPIDDTYASISAPTHKSLAEVVWCFDDDDEQSPELEANGYLIAAAPELLEALKDVLAHLVAAHSLLQSGGKKAAPSNTMFMQMLKDYEKSIDAGRTALAKARGE
jgi:hypothetical protein